MRVKIQHPLPDMTLCATRGWVQGPAPQPVKTPQAPRVRLNRPVALPAADYQRLRRAKLVSQGLTTRGTVRKNKPRKAR